MSMRAAEKIIESLTLLMEGFLELQESIESEYGEDSEDELETEEEEEDEEFRSEGDIALINEVQAALDAVIDTEDLAPEQVATMLSVLTDALEEIDPDVFEEEDDDLEEEDDEDEEEYEDDALDDSELYEEGEEDEDEED